jgi:3-dehydroquinate dehydratase I
MKKAVTVKGLTLGEGVPKVCVSLVGRSKAELIAEAQYVKTLETDIVEWRVDFFEDVEDLPKVIAALSKIREILLETPLIFTFRSKKEGGEKEISTEYYLELNKEVINTNHADMIDIELFNEDKVVNTLVEIAQANNIYVIISNHDFSKTPEKDELVSRLRKAIELGADIPKIAVMPNNSRDVLTLLTATNQISEQFRDIPIITISMGGLGTVSRFSGEIFGSSLTFAAGRSGGSAPGQLSVLELRKILSILHKTLQN